MGNYATLPAALCTPKPWLENRLHSHTEQKWLWLRSCGDGLPPQVNTFPSIKTVPTTTSVLAPQHLVPTDVAGCPCLVQGPNTQEVLLLGWRHQRNHRPDQSSTRQVREQNGLGGRPHLLKPASPNTLPHQKRAVAGAGAGRQRASVHDIGPLAPVLLRALEPP